MRPIWPLFMALLLHGMALPASAAEGPGPERADAWKIGAPIVTYWAGPALSDAVARQMAEGGFNLVWCGESQLDVARRHGLRAQLQDGLLAPRSLEDPARRAQLDALVDRVRNHPALYCYFITDEPGAEEFAALGKLVAYLRQRDPAHMAYINLFPTYANNQQLGTEGDTVTAYREHLRQYVEVVKPALVSYDNYQFSTRGDNEQYFLNLAMVRRASLQAGVPFLNIVQACTWTPSMRVPTPDEMRYLVYTTVAYGAEGISYYVYCHPRHTGGIALPDGTPTPIYHALKTLNREFVAIAGELKPLRSLGAYHAGMTPPGAEPLAADAPFRLDPPLAPIEHKPLEPVKGVLLGLFGPDAEGIEPAKPTHAVVVNLDYRAEATVALVGPGRLETFNATAGTWSAPAGNRVEVRLPPGGGKLLRAGPATSSAAMNLVPLPVSVKPGEGRFELTGKTVVVAQAAGRAEAERLAADLRTPTGFELPVTGDQPSGECIVLELDPGLESSLGPEGYRLSVAPTRIEIRAASDAGLFYGGVTLRQLLPPFVFSRSVVKAVSRAVPEGTPGRVRREPPQPVRWTAPCVEIEDSPRFPWRGLLLDVARHYMPPEFIKRLVDLAALHKMNSLQLHLTDDQGWRLEIKKHPRLTQIGSIRKESPRHGDRNRGDGTPYGPLFYTQEEIRDLVAYAKVRHVTLVPEIEMPGHFLAALTAYPQYSCRGGPFELRTRWGIEADILCPGNDASLAFVEDVLAEVVELFPGPFVHIGGDEAPRARWKECPKCQARIRAEGLTSEAELQTWLNHRVEKFLADRGRRLIGWDEILEGGLTPGAAVTSWRGTRGGIAAATAGHDVVMSPTSHCYFDYAQARGPGEPECIGGFIPLATVYAFEPVPPTLQEEKRKHILGAQGNLWTEYMWTPRDVEYSAFPRAAALAEVVWSPAGQRNFDDFRHRLQTHLGRLDQLDVNYRRLDPPR